MIYNLKQVTGVYVRGFLSYVKSKNFTKIDSEALYDLFSYALETIYKLPAAETNEYISLYGDECIAYLKKLKNVPKRVDRLGLNDRVSVVTMCRSYFVAADFLAGSEGLVYGSGKKPL